MPDVAVHTLRLPSTLREQIMIHLVREAPNEGVGLLAVSHRDGIASATAFFPGENIDASPTRFTMHPRDVVTALDTIAEHGWELGAIVHSHVKGPASPSRTDLGQSHYPDTLMVIVSLAHYPPDMRGWRLDEEDGGVKARPVAVDVVESPPTQENP